MEVAVLKALSKQRAERHASVEAFVLALREAFAQPPLAPTSPAIASRSNTKEEWFSVGRDHQKAKRYEEALAAYDQVIRLDPNDADTYNNKGNALNALKRNEEALAAYDQAIRLNPRYAYACNNKGVALNDLKRYEEALAAYDQAIRLDPNDADTYYNKGNILRYALKRNEV
ncbi:tetratricopeptide repeat protein [Ktedonospora formicarum]